MADCDKLKTSFSDYIDGDIPIEQRRQLDDHFEICLQCREILRQMKIIQDSLKKLPQINTSAEFERKLHQQIFNPPSRSHFMPPILSNWKLPAMGSAIVLATVGLFLVLDDSSDSGNKDADGSRGPVINAVPRVSSSPRSGAIAEDEAVTEDGKDRSREQSIADSSRVNQEGFQQTSGQK
ncbi:MAG: zf-HC2 domain-containing protein [Calditrichaeota bacterium]|nr:zf-HC2 domain-containing protein [Calditrichota bacterium]RQW03866.1 MAG: zf-HC2 domain-containing protein [Calditrichota bacterium]